MVIVAGAPVDEMAKEREGAPLYLPHRSCPFYLIFPSFFVTVLSPLIPLGGVKSNVLSFF
jgi:hypothetical protein